MLLWNCVNYLVFKGVWKIFQVKQIKLTRSTHFYGSPCFVTKTWKAGSLELMSRLLRNTDLKLLVSVCSRSFAAEIGCWGEAL